MNSRERTSLSLAHKPADRLPIDFWASSATRLMIEKSLSMNFTTFLDKHDVDLRYIEGPVYKGPRLEPDSDIWGVRRTNVGTGAAGGGEVYSEVKTSPLADAGTAAEIENYGHWPSADWFDYECIEKQCDEVHAAGRVSVFMGDRLNRIAQLKPAMYLRGVEQILIDLAMQQEIAETIFLRIKNFYSTYIERILRAARGKIDIVLTGDDFGTQNGLLLSPEMWREFLKPGFEEYIGLVKSHGAKAMHHTCGSVAGLIPDMIESGLDILQSLQPEAKDMDIVNLQAAFGDRLCFHGGISVQKTMPFGSAEDVRREVARMADLFRKIGGYIFCTSHNVQADTPLANIVALLGAYHES